MKQNLDEILDTLYIVLWQTKGVGHVWESERSGNSPREVIANFRNTLSAEAKGNVEVVGIRKYTGGVNIQVVQ